MEINDDWWRSKGASACYLPLYSIYTTEDIVKLFIRPGSPITLGFDPQRRYPIPRGTHSSVALNIHVDGKMAIFD